VKSKTSTLTTILTAAALFLIMTPATVTAQDGTEDGEELPAAGYSLGDQIFSLNAGLCIPLFFFGGPQVSPTNMSLGGAGSLHWAAYLNNHLTLGGELSGSFSFSPLGRTVAIIPITVKMSYFFYAYPFEIPIHLGAGVSITTLEELYHVGPILKPGASFYWNINGTWAIGLNLVYWFTPQWYVNPDLREQSRYGNFLETTFSLLYHF
jgi:hypothetical protein